MFSPSESARCEAVIFPVPAGRLQKYAEDYALWIKKPITYDEIYSVARRTTFISTRSELGMLVVV